jgi:hypothetical protein
LRILPFLLSSPAAGTAKTIATMVTVVCRLAIGMDVSREAEEYPLLEAVTKQRLANIADWEYFKWALVIS